MFALTAHAQTGLRCPRVAGMVPGEKPVTDVRMRPVKHPSRAQTRS
jgi:hypothetical protein